MSVVTSIPIPALVASRVGRTCDQYVSIRQVWPLLLLVLLLGLTLRAACFVETAPIRFRGDMDNAWAKGSYILTHGLAATYDPANNTGIDYPPLRAYLKTGWVAVVRAVYGPAAQPSDGTLWPLLLVNWLFGLFNATGVYYLCRTGFGKRASLLAAVATWLNPALIFDGWGFVQYDLWGAAPLVWAAGAGFRKRFFLMGVLIGMAAMLKGQTLLVAPWFLALIVMDVGWQQRGWRAGAGRIGGRAAALVAGVGLAVFVAVLPFTLERSIGWAGVYFSAPRHVPLASGALNAGHIMEFQYLWTAEDVGDVDLPVLGLPLGTRLKWAYAAWLALIIVLTVRAQNDRRRLLGLGLAFAAMYALAPGMHERYGIWAAAMLAPALCLQTPTVLLYAIISAAAFVAPLLTCLRYHPQFAPLSLAFLRTTADYWSWAWCAATIVLTVFLARSARAQQTGATPGAMPNGARGSR